MVVISTFKFFHRSLKRKSFREGWPGNETEELFGTDFEAGGELDHAIKLHIGFGTLHAANVISVDATKLRELLL